MKTNFVLVDFENVQPKNVSLLSGGPFKIKVFLGANQAKLPLEMVRVIQAFGPDAEYIQIDGSGSNALDFHIAYYIGRLAAETPDAYFLLGSGLVQCSQRRGGATRVYSRICARPFGGRTAHSERRKYFHQG